MKQLQPDVTDSTDSQGSTLCYITILLLSLFTATMNLFFSFWVDGDADVSLSLLTVFVRLVLSAALSFQLAASGSNHESFTAEHLRFTSQL